MNGAHSIRATHLKKVLLEMLELSLDRAVYSVIAAVLHDEEKT